MIGWIKWKERLDEYYSALCGAIQKIISTCLAAVDVTTDEPNKTVSPITASRSVFSSCSRNSPRCYGSLPYTLLEQGIGS
jgi:hypothetical protein